jgi:hypothetical protein
MTNHSHTSLMALLLALPCAAVGGEADVISARAIRTVDGRYDFEVTIQSQDRGWDHFADRFEVLAPDGTVLGVRPLAYPHVDEQPFTRELNGVLIPDGLDTVVIRAHHRPRGYDGATVHWSCRDRGLYLFSGYSDRER